ncbi:hypothetical protein [Halobaculum sp. D14]|uniref:hypothetical protein n=1 Tax=unclassified Halobaculum TaxID=2640896 RepID=UPI003EB76728
MALRLAPAFLTAPSSFIDRSVDWGSFDFLRWSTETYEYDPDDWNGLKNTVRPVEQVIRSGRGDCEDYALVALSWLHATVDAGDVGLAVLYTREVPPTGHVIAFGPERTFSSGVVCDGTLEQYLRGSRYDVMFTNTL